MKTQDKQHVQFGPNSLTLSISENSSRLDLPLQPRSSNSIGNKGSVRDSMNNHRRELEQLEREIQAELGNDLTTQSTRPILTRNLQKYQQSTSHLPQEQRVGLHQMESQIEQQMALKMKKQSDAQSTIPLNQSKSLGGLLLSKVGADSIHLNKKGFLPLISPDENGLKQKKKRYPEPIRSINFSVEEQPRQQSLPYIQADRVNYRSLSSSGLSDDSSNANGSNYLKSSSILKNKALLIHEGNVQAPSFNHRNSKLSIHQPGEFTQASISGGSSGASGTEDTVSFDQINIQTEKALIQKYLEFINSENDLYFLQGNFPNLYKSDLEEQQNKQGAIINGALAICYDKGYSDSCSRESIRKLLPNFHVQLKKIASNPMISAGLASNQVSKRSDQAFSENSSNFGMSNAQFDDSVSVSQAKSSKSYSSKSSFFSRMAPCSIRQISINQLLDEMKVIGSIPLSHSGEVVAHQKAFTYNISLLTKFKVNIDLGFVQVSINTLNQADPSSYNACTIHRLYISRIYRKLGHAKMIYLKTYHFLFSTFKNLSKLSIFISNKSSALLKFQYSIGFRFDTVAQDSEDERNKPTRVKLLLKRTEFTQIYNEFIKSNSNS